MHREMGGESRHGMYLHFDRLHNGSLWKHWGFLSQDKLKFTTNDASAFLTSVIYSSRNISTLE